MGQRFQQPQAGYHIEFMAGRPFGCLVNALLERVLLPGTGLLTLAIQSAKPLWVGQLPGNMSES